MLSTIFNLLKAGAVIFYLVALASLVVEPLMDYQLILLSVVTVLLLVHVAEFLIIKNKLQQISKTGSHHLLNVLLFGFLYWIPLLYTDRNGNK
ncbi:MAG: hypothetical protein V7731_15690 [Amphritea sp.]